MIRYGLAIVGTVGQMQTDNGVLTHPTERLRSLLEINLNCAIWISDMDGHGCVGELQGAVCPRRKADKGNKIGYVCHPRGKTSIHLTGASPAPVGWEGRATEKCVKRSLCYYIAPENRTGFFFACVWVWGR